MLDIRQSKNYATYLEDVGWKVGKNKNFYFYYKKLPIVGNIVKIQRPEIIDKKSMQEILNSKKKFWITVEPTKKEQTKFLTDVGFKNSKTNYLPTKTLVINLSKDKNSILGNMKNDAKKAIKKNGQLKTREYLSPDIKQFRKAWRNILSIKRHVPSTKNLTYLKKAFGKNSLYLTDEKCTTGAIFLKINTKAYYWQAFTGKEGREKLFQYKIVWEGICWAKKNRAKFFDFEGIYDERLPNKSWLGFTHFKKSFGGEEVSFPLPLKRGLF